MQRLRALFAIALAITIVIALVIILSLPSLAHDTTVLYTGHLDADDINDTVVGVETGDLRLMPTAIRWGSEKGDGSSTLLRYPEWAGLNGSLAVEDVNGDRRDDLLLFFRDAAGRDSSRAVALLAQRALRRASSIDLAALPHGVQWHPFVAIDLGAVEVLREPRRRELSGVASWQWGTVAIATADSAATGAAPLDIAGWSALYPNPAMTEATFAASRLAAGTYSVEIVDVDGTVHHDREIVVEREQPLSASVDLGDFPAGLYLVRIRSAAQIIMAWPVVVVR